MTTNSKPLALSVADVLPDGCDDPLADAPHVAVVVSLTFPGMGEESYQIMKDFTRSAFQQLALTGLRPFLIDSAEADPAAVDLARKADAVLFLGGGDVDASLYGHAGDVPNEYGTDRKADEFCLSLIRDTLQLDQPLLAICRGSQLLNVACGGTLIPDLDPSDLHRGKPGEPLFLDEEVILQPGSKIAAIFGRDRMSVRSGHHQAVGKVAPDLMVTALAHDGVVEGTEHRTREWAVGVQWHPEDPAGSDRDRTLLFAEFAAQAVVHQKRRNDALATITG